MKKQLLLSFVAFTLAGSNAIAAKKNKNTKPYPYGNPVITHMYTADAAPHVMPDGRVWMVTSVDHEEGGGYATMHSYHTFSSADMVNWIDHGEVLNVTDLFGPDGEPEGEDWALWAPDMIYHEGKYYLYYPVRILYKEAGYDEQTRKTKSYIAVAVSDSPDKPFTIINPKIEGTGGIDPAIFIDDDGEKYLYYGSHDVAKLKDNMYEIEGRPIKLEVNDKRFMEASWMHKRDGKYFLSYHAHYGKPIDPNNPDDPKRDKSTLHYGISDNPLGPFKFMGVMNHELGVDVKNGPKLPGYDFVPWRLYQSNHGGIVEFHGQEYLFYHTSALSSWRQDEFKGPGTWTQRSVCIDELNYHADGSLMPVQQTLEGVDPVTVKQPFAIKLKTETPELLTTGTQTYTFDNIDLGTGYYYFGVQVKSCSGKGRLEVRLDNAKGLLLGTIRLSEKAASINGGKAETFLRNANGQHNICLVAKMEGDAKLTFSNPIFFAGSPAKK